MNLVKSTVLLSLACLLAYPGPSAAADKANANIVQESFFTRLPDDLMALTHSGELNSAPIPEGIPKFTEPGAAGSVAFLFKLRDASGEVIGFATQLEVLAVGQPVATSEAQWPTEWVLVIPKRGTLFLHEIEQPTQLREEVFKPTVAQGPDGRWSGEIVVQTTVGPRSDGRGIIVGGTRDFEGATGTFVEIDTLTGFSVKDGLEGNIEIRVYRDVSHKQ